MAMNHHEPSLSSIVDMMTVRIEYAESIGNTPESDALRKARTTVLDHVFREELHLSWIARILIRIHLPRKVAA